MGGISKFYSSFAACWLCLATANAHAWNVDLRGDVGVEARGFWESARFHGQTDADSSLLLRPELHLEREGGHEQVVLAPFLRVDSSDAERTRADLRELAWTKAWDVWELRLGVQHVFWGVAESTHVVDIINQTDQIENPDGEDKLGQPMATLALVRPWGTVDLMVMPWFRERTFPGKHGRLRTPVPVDVDNARYESHAKAKHVDFAVRYSVNWDSLDLGIHQFHGTNREPLLVPSLDARGHPRLTPFYTQIDQTGVDLLYAVGGWLFKYEGIYRSGQGDGFTSMVGGFEYTWAGLANSFVDFGLLLELNYDSRGRVATTPFNRDVFVGVRFAPNDTAGTQILAGVLLDVVDDETLLNVEVQRRLGEHWRLGVELRAFDSPQRSGPLAWIDADDYLGLEISRFF